MKIKGLLLSLALILCLSACNSSDINGSIDDDSSLIPSVTPTPDNEPSAGATDSIVYPSITPTVEPTDSIVYPSVTPTESVMPTPTPTISPTPTIVPTPTPTIEPSDYRLNLTFSDSYYDDLNGYLDVDFKIKLHALIETTHINQGSYSDAWAVLKAADQDPSNSSNILCIYTGRSIPIANQDTGSSGDNIWNREHVWPKSLGFSSKSNPAHNDCHHLHASEKNINSTRGNKDFGEVIGGTTDSYGNSWNSSYFEPRDEVKGDIARSILYMVVRYNGDDCDSCTLDLEMVDGTANTGDIVSGTRGYIGDIDTLLKWHYEDPVSEEEKNRNDIVYSYQGNRNPFIDHEEFVTYLYTDLVSEYTSIDGLAYLM